MDDLELGTNISTESEHKSELVMLAMEKQFPRMAKMATVMSLDSDFLVFNRFRRLNLFVIIYLQDRLTEINHDLQNRITTNKSGKGIKERNEEFEELLKDAKLTLKEYSE